MKRHTKALAGGLDGTGNFYVGIAWRGVARRMVVDHHERARVEFECALAYLARIDRSLIDLTHALLLCGDETVLAVQKQDMKALAWQYSRTLSRKLRIWRSWRSSRAW